MTKTSLAVLILLVGLNAHHVFAQSKDEESKKTDDEKQEEQYSKDVFRLSVFSRIVNQKQVAEELEIVGSQKQAIKKILDEYQNRYRLISIEMEKKRRVIDEDKSLSSQQRREKRDEIRMERKTRGAPHVKKTIEKIESELLRHQFKRLNQLAVQEHQRLSYAYRYVALSFLFDELEVPEPDRPRIKKNLQEIQQDYTRQVRLLQMKYQQKLIDRMPDSTKEKVKSLVAELEAIDQ